MHLPHHLTTPFPQAAPLALRHVPAMRAPLHDCAEEPAPSEAAQCQRGDVVVVAVSSPRKKCSAPELKLRLPPPETGATARLRGLLCFVAVTVLTASYSLLVEASKTSGGRFAYSPLAVTFVAESVKLVVSLLMLRCASGGPPQPQLRGSDLMRAAAPALLYCGQNNAAFAALRYLTPPLYQLLSNLKIMATAVLSCIILRRKFSRLQWTGVAMLTLASALPGVASLMSSKDGGASSGLTPHALLAGTAIMACVALSSGLAGVLTEKLLKTAAGSMHYKNAQLYACGVLLYLPAVYVSLLAPANGSPAAIFAGWTPFTVLVVANLSLQGLAISWLLRLAGNVEKLFAGAGALFASMALSGPLFGYVARPADLAGACLACAALALFHWRELAGAS